MRIKILYFTDKGKALAERLKAGLAEHDAVIVPKGVPLAFVCGDAFADSEALVFIGATGIAVRAIAPYVRDKLKDPPVIVMDENGSFVIPLLSGHVGGANSLAIEIAESIEAQPVITTATDVSRTFSVDVFAKENGLRIANRDGIAKVSSSALEGKPVTICIKDYPPKEPVDVLIADEEAAEGLKDPAKIVLCPKRYAIGMGCRKGKAFEDLMAFAEEVLHENGIDISGICADHLDVLDRKLKELPLVTESPEELIDAVDAVYIHSHPAMHYEQVKLALQQGKHVLCEAPFALNRGQTEELFGIAQEKKLILMEGIKTAYSTAYERLLLLAKTGKIGDIVNVQATCTSLRQPETLGDTGLRWNSICEWGPTALLPIFQLLGTEYRSKSIVTRLKDSREKYDDFTKVDFLFPHAAGSILVGKGIKSEGELVISGTKGYIYVPAPWWKTDYFEIRYENPENNRRYFYQLDGEGIRYELVAFVRSAEKGQSYSAIEKQVTAAIDNVIADFYRGIDVTKL